MQHKNLSGARAIVWDLVATKPNHSGGRDLRSARKENSDKAPPARGHDPKANTHTHTHTQPQRREHGLSGAAVDPGDPGM